ncbi:hypothetical protein E1178_07070 [Roseibium hamelinense]|uniref:hypothetical protein n=1 Tax=Roseibium hamelinense TaxID=150831 RepID=UPI00119F35D5|nr:hypothetical protein [Roseibium hamelinense]MTI43369.1 hypothetical protein [Roseibium hamelinense]
MAEEKFVQIAGMQEDIDRQRAWEAAAEDCVLARIDHLRIFGGLPRHLPPLTEQQRRDRLKLLMKLWSSGCTCVVDEALFADIINRRRPKRSATA